MEVIKLHSMSQILILFTSFRLLPMFTWGSNIFMV